MINIELYLVIEIFSYSAHEKTMDEIGLENEREQFPGSAAIGFPLGSKFLMHQLLFIMDADEDQDTKGAHPDKPDPRAVEQAETGT